MRKCHGRVLPTPRGAWPFFGVLRASDLGANPASQSQTGKKGDRNGEETDRFGCLVVLARHVRGFVQLGEPEPPHHDYGDHH
jgi:hypothetical protein